MACGINSAGDRCAPLAILEIGEVDRDLRPRKSKVLQHKIPTARRRALWENVQQTRLKGLSFRAMARELGVHRNTIRKYALAESPSLRKKKSEASTQQPETGAAPNRTFSLDINTRPIPYDGVNQTKTACFADGC